MRKPLRVKNPKGPAVRVGSIASPIGGWNARDPLAMMNPLDAVQLKNWFPTTVDCVVRGGNTNHGTTITGVVETLPVYNAINGTSKMFAATDTDVYNVSSSGAGTAQSLTVTEGKWQYLNFGDGTNQYLIMVNGVDAPYYYDGSSWTLITGASSPLLSGVTLTSLINVCEYHGRLFFLEKDTLSFWYLAANAAGGALTEFKLDSFASLGGYLMWAATWSFDGGDGLDDYIVFMTSKGEAIVYAGTNPSTASTWVRKGTYQLGEPLGRRSYVQYGGDLIAITQNGAFPLSQALQSSDLNKKTAITDKIENAFNVASGTYGSNFGWEATVFSAKSAIIFNIPVAEGGTHKQYVMNTITKAWCEFDSWDAECFAVYNQELYFGGSAKVQKAWTGAKDVTSEIVALGKAAFNYFGMESQNKRFNMFRPMLKVNGSISFLTGLDIDFEDKAITALASYTVPSSALWDTALWDAGLWTASLSIIRQWTSPSATEGYAASGNLKVNTDSLEVHWIACDYVYETGGVI